ncbi:unnamed protein product [Lepeophtheirus salmonis]|uniref:(salmon louse) hypothetical protein n=1 Tax=Lepeophtheirus salmonis TaxID=72036 RepID=A0A7R8GZ76_LEPSM|nr:unnamed protein product [Lepeophtheirus salmonis]CAF2759213.1 unnamed protein product [Lepeophtheirus salmonis]
MKRFDLPFKLKLFLIFCNIPTKSTLLTFFLFSRLNLKINYIIWEEWIWNSRRIKSLKTELVDLKMRKLELLSKNMDLSQISSSRDQLQFLNTIRGYYIEDKKNGNTVIHFNDATKSSLVLNKKNFLVSINIPKNIARLDIGFHSYESRRLQAQKMTDMYHGKGLFQVNFREEDLEILLEQCSVFNNYQLDVALGKSFLSL